MTQRGRVNDNPSAQEFCKNYKVIRVIQTSMAIVEGNCRGCEMEDNTDVPIKRRKSYIPDHMQSLMQYLILCIHVHYCI